MVDNNSIKWTKRVLKANWHILAVLLIFFIALFVRSYFAYGPAVNNSSTKGELLVSGGSDSYYHKHIIDQILKDHRQFGVGPGTEPLLNYPIAAKNPRPPLFHGLDTLRTELERWPST